MSFEDLNDTNEDRISRERVYGRNWVRAKRAAAKATEMPELLRLANSATKLSTAEERIARRKLIGRGASLADRIRAWVRVSENGCWEWRGKRNWAGYGRICISRAIGDQQVHRVAYETFVAPIPDGMQIDHLCRNRACCNPEHLEVVTGRENVRRSTAPIARNMDATHCLRGHPLEGENLYLYKGKRKCKTCQKARNRALREKRRHQSHFASCPNADKHRRPR